MAEKKKKKDKEKDKVRYHHRADALWLTSDICKEYQEKANKLNSTSAEDTGQRRELRMELQRKCDINELEAINILNGYNIQGYVEKYKRVKGILEGTISVDEKKSAYTAEYLEWLGEKETNKNDQYSIEED